MTGALIDRQALLRTARLRWPDLPDSATVVYLTGDVVTAHLPGNDAPALNLPMFSTSVGGEKMYMAYSAVKELLLVNER